MKRVSHVLLAALMVFAVAGQAAASFEDLHLVRTLYDTTTSVERGSDLGLNALSTTGAYGTTNVNVGDLVAASTFSGGLGNVRVAYWAANDAALATADYWATGFGSGVSGSFVTDGDGLQLGNRKGSALQSMSGFVQGYYGTGGLTTFAADKANVNSYSNRIDTGFESNQGSFGNNMSSSAYWELNMNLADLATIGYVDQILYYFADYNNGAAPNGTAVATLRTYLSGGNIGTTIIPLVGTPPAVPVPAALWLLGTGLVGLVGIRRRKN